MPISVALVRKLEELDPQLRGVLLAMVEELERQREESVTKKEFNELKEVVKELVHAQKRTEERLGELAEAQKRTEARVEELAEAQRKTEARLDSLAERVEELAEAQKRTEARVEKLAEAQHKTEEKLERLIDEHRKTREQLGGLSHTVGYRLEDEAIWALPELLNKDFGIKVLEGLRRGYVETTVGKYVEVNIWGEGEKNGKKLAILGEAKSQLKKRDVSAFVKTVSRLEDMLDTEIFPVLITYQTSPEVEKAAKERNVKIYFSYELKRG